MTEFGVEMHELCSRLFPICRSITGNGVRETLAILQEDIPMKVHEVPSGTQVFDWEVPQEWNISDAYVTDEAGNRIIDFQESNLHVMGYSTPVDARVTLEELEEHLHSLEDQPDAIPYVTSYYKERWGFCLQHNRRKKLTDQRYHVVIDSTLTDGHLTYGELILPGESDQEIFISTYICHPSMANNELSGPVVATFLARWLMDQPRRYTYRFIFIPETIGAITYLSRHLDHLKQRVIAGFNLTCIGDDRTYSFVRSRYGNTYADRLIRYVLQSGGLEHTEYSYLERGSDERQYGSPGVDLPLVTVCRSKFGTYPEYHTSLDNLDLVTPSGLGGSLLLLQKCVNLIEQNRRYTLRTKGEPQLGKRGLYPSVSKVGSADTVKGMMNVLAYADGTNDLLELSEHTGLSVEEIIPIIARLEDAELLDSVPAP